MSDYTQEKTVRAYFWDYLTRNMRDRLAIRLVNLSAVLIIIMLIASFYFLSHTDTTAANSYQAIKDIFTMLLPVIGTWIGTVIAFYFSRENFQAAAQQAKELAQSTTSGELPNETSAVKAMRLLSDKDVVRYIFTPDKGMAEFRKLKLKSEILNQYLKSPIINRLPVQDEQKKIIFIIHQSLITNFIVRKNNTDDLLTMGDLLDSDEGKIATRFATAGIDEHLSEVKVKLDKDPCCQDVFITLDGTANSPAIGWITNVRLEEYVTVK